MEYKRKTEKVEAIQWFPNVHVEGVGKHSDSDFMYAGCYYLRGVTSVLQSGDYIITKNGKRSVMSKKEFEKTYKET